MGGLRAGWTVVLAAAAAAMLGPVGDGRAEEPPETFEAIQKEHEIADAAARRQAERARSAAELKAASDAIWDETKRTAAFSTSTCTYRNRNRSYQRAEGRHHDRSEPDKTTLVDRFGRTHPFFAFGIDGKINHHDGIFLHDADEHNDSYD